MAEPQGNGSPQEPQGTEPPEGTKGLTLDDVNRAITGRLKAFEGSFVKSFSATLDEKLAALAPKPPEGDKPKDALGDEDPRLKALQKQISELKNKNAEADARLAEQAARSRDQRMRGATTEELSRLGLDATRAKLALPHLLAERRIAVEVEDDVERFVWRDEHGETKPLAEGLRSWASTEEAKIFLPPRGAAGSGDTTRRGSAGGAPSTPEQKADAILREGFLEHLI